jgi:diadenosine tetraphosphate (Ap4A) HIT family hydrolase
VTPIADCELCVSPGGALVWEQGNLRVVMIDEPSFPGFCRVIWLQHTRELTDLSQADRRLLMDVVWQVEESIRSVLRPDKINLASLGNLTPHVHWHVIPRYHDDSHFPQPVWGIQQRTTPEGVMHGRRALLNDLREKIAFACSRLCSEKSMDIQ